MTTNMKSRTCKVEVLDHWFKTLSFEEMEEITGYRQSRFNPEDGYQEFVDACESWWFAKNVGTKREIYRQYADYMGN